jgi:PKD domain
MRRFLLPVTLGLAALAMPAAAHAADPVAGFTFSPAAPDTTTRVTFTSTSTDADGDIDRLRWDLNGNGRFEREGSPEEAGTVTARFRVAGVYTITLQVTDDEGGSSSVDHTVTVASPSAPPPPPTPAPAPPTSAGPPVSVKPAAAVAGNAARNVAPARLLAPFPTVRIQGRVFSRGAAIKRFTVNAPRGARVRVLCTGRTCPKRKALVKVARKTQILRFSGIERRLAFGTVVEVYVNRKGRVGKYTRFVIRRQAAPARQDMCVLSMRRSPSTCPSR